jgi:glycosyltransferase involved in cell wall biosynthesis
VRIADGTDNVLPSIRRPYLLICPIPHYRGEDGSIWLDRLWHHDLAEHLTYLRNFTLLSPVLPRPAGDTELVRLEPPSDGSFDVVAIPPMDSFAGALRSLPRLAVTLWRAIGRAEIVHSGVAGWPIAIGWIANPIALARGRKLVIVVESAFWRIAEGQPASRKARLRERVTEFLARLSVNRAHLLLFTQPSYRKSLLTWGKGKAFVTPATWINDADILADAEAERDWEGKLGAEVPSLLFAGRLVPDKGIDVLSQALRLLDERGVRLRVDVIGEGPRRAACVELQRSLRTVQLSLLDPVPYGKPFFDLLRRHHAVVVPSLSDEQPRLVFDAFAQALPVLASRTDGLAANVVEGKNGWLFEPGDPPALARTLERAADLHALRGMGLAALASARGLTHREMHRTRCRILIDCFGAG